MRFIVFLIRISALPGWRVYNLILSQQEFKIVRALYTKMDGSGVYSTVQYSIKTHPLQRAGTNPEIYRNGFTDTKKNVFKLLFLRTSDNGTSFERVSTNSFPLPRRTPARPSWGPSPPPRRPTLRRTRRPVT